MDDLKAFATQGAKILDLLIGDLTGDGRQGALLVLDPPASGTPRLGEGPAREIMLLMRDASGRFEKTASSFSVIPAAASGGVAGDPYGYTRIDGGGFTIANGGGSRERWSDEYNFRYVAAAGTWRLVRVVRQVEDSESGEHRQLILTPETLGEVAFADFDPASLPEVTLP
jgi:hypothetical protein